MNTDKTIDVHFGIFFSLSVFIAHVVVETYLSIIPYIYVMHNKILFKNDKLYFIIIYILYIR